MPNQILVRVRNKSLDENGHPTELNGTTSVITYKAFGYTRDKFEIIEQVAEDGTNPDGSVKYKSVPGNPNLEPQYRTALPKRSADHAADAVEPETAKKKSGRPAKQLQEQTA